MNKWLMILLMLPLQVNSTPTAVATFHSIGLYWKTAEGGEDNECAVRYRIRGEETWREGMSLWFDGNTTGGIPLSRSREYRGSILELQADTYYEVRLRLASGVESGLEVKTWSEQFPIKKVVRVAPGDNMLRIDEGGGPDGYVLYEGGPLDVGNKAHACIEVNASYVIIRGMRLIGGQKHGIYVGEATDVVIEHNDISGWGVVKPDGWGDNQNAGIYASNAGIERLVIQYNTIHHPRSDSNSWREPKRTIHSPGGSHHPYGPEAISLLSQKDKTREGNGNHVIRYNRIHSDDKHMFMDGMGANNNCSFGGFPARDTDIYGNTISHVWDDAIESEGANMNVRIWGNYVTDSFVAFAHAGTSLGPLYLFRNIGDRSRKGPDESGGSGGGTFVKLGQSRDNLDYLKGRIYIFHNTALQAEGAGAGAETLGYQNGIVLTNKEYVQYNIWAANNIIQMRGSRYAAINDPGMLRENVFEHNLCHGRVIANAEVERGNLAGKPIFMDEAPEGLGYLRELAPASPGRDHGLVLPNINEDYGGSGPDIGAVEAGRPMPAHWTAHFRAGCDRVGEVEQEAIQAEGSAPPAGSL